MLLGHYLLFRYIKKKKKKTYIFDACTVGSVSSKEKFGVRVEQKRK